MDYILTKIYLTVFFLQEYVWTVYYYALYTLHIFTMDIKKITIPNAAEMRHAAPRSRATRVVARVSRLVRWKKEYVPSSMHKQTYIICLFNKFFI